MNVFLFSNTRPTQSSKVCFCSHNVRVYRQVSTYLTVEYHKSVTLFRSIWSPKSKTAKSAKAVFYLSGGWHAQQARSVSSYLGAKNSKFIFKGALWRAWLEICRQNLTAVLSSWGVVGICILRPSFVKKKTCAEVIKRLICEMLHYIYTRKVVDVFKFCRLALKTWTTKK